MSQPFSTGSWEIQGFDKYGRAVWSSGAETIPKTLAYLVTCMDDLDEDHPALLIRRGPQVEVVDGDCPVIGPWRLAPAECPDCARDRAGEPS